MKQIAQVTWFSRYARGALERDVISNHSALGTYIRRIIFPFVICT